MCVCIEHSVAISLCVVVVDSVKYIVTQVLYLVHHSILFSHLALFFHQTGREREKEIFVSVCGLFIINEKLYFAMCMQQTSTVKCPGRTAGWLVLSR